MNGKDFIFEKKRVVQAFGSWFKNLPFTFKEIPGTKKMLSKYCEHKKGDAKVDKIAEMLREALKKLEEVVPSPMRTDDDESTNILSFKEGQINNAIAKQMALLDYTYYTKMKPSEFLKQGWSKNGEVNAPNILKFIDWFNNTSRWVSSQILSGKTEKDRAKIIEAFIDIANVKKKANFMHTFFLLEKIIHLRTTFFFPPQSFFVPAFFFQFFNLVSRNLRRSEISASRLQFGDLSTWERLADSRRAGR